MSMPTGPPSLGLLTESQRTIVEETLDRLNRLKFDKRAIDPIKKELLVRFADACRTEEDGDRMASELDLWVRWRRKEAYWLTDLFQLAVRDGGWPITNRHLKIKADLLYSDAQVNFNDSLAVSSLEVAYNDLVQLKHFFGDYAPELEARISGRLRLYYGFYTRWCRPFDPAECNPIVEHLYSCKTFSDLILAFPQLGVIPLPQSGTPWRGFSTRAGGIVPVVPFEILFELNKIVHSCDSSGDVYHSVVARRFLGQLCQDAGNITDALSAFAIALTTAKEAALDTEIGHLYRCQGEALLRAGYPLQAAKSFGSAYHHEEESFPYATYWEALTLRRLGDVRMARAENVTTDEDREIVLKMALDAYKVGLNRFEGNLSASTLLPIDMGVRQQMFRPFSERALSVDTRLNDKQSILAEIEANGPREASEIVMEILAAQELKASKDSIDEYRKMREVFHRYLTTVPTKFEDYLESLPEQYRMRHDYMRLRISITKPIFHSLMSDEVAEQILSTRMPAAAFLLFNVGWDSSVVALLDCGTGEVKFKDAPFRAKDLSSLHQQYSQDCDRAKAIPVPDAVMTSALDQLLEAYERMLGGVLEELLSPLECSSLMIFPCLQMNAVPFHALKLGSRSLIDAFDVSYCPTMGLFLKLHGGTKEAFSRLSVVFDPAIVSFQGLVKELIESRSGKISVMQSPIWQDFLKSVSGSQTGDLLFACHGQYNAGNPADSRIFIDGNEGASFSQIFSDLDLQGYRSVVLGACESGLVRTEVATEYIGLPIAFLSAGVHHVIGSMWKVNRWATSILLGRYFELLNSETLTVTASLNRAQRELASMGTDQVIEWLNKYCPQYAGDLEPQIRKMGDLPFSHPYYWAGFYVSGDF